MTRTRRSVRRAAWFHTLGIVILLSALAGSLWLCWIAWSTDSKEVARRSGLEARAAASGLLDGDDPSRP